MFEGPWPNPPQGQTSDSEGEDSSYMKGMWDYIGRRKRKNTFSVAMAVSLPDHYFLSRMFFSSKNVLAIQPLSLPFALLRLCCRLHKSSDSTVPG